MDEFARKLPEYNKISEIPGCGNKLTSRIIAEIGDIRRFKNSCSLIVYANLMHYLINLDNLKQQKKHIKAW